MPVEVAQGILNITPSMRGLQALIDREMRGVDSRRAGQQAGEGYTGGFGASAKKLTGILGGAFAAVKIGDFAKSAVAQASDLNEAGTKLQVVFGDATGSINDFASGGAKALGQSKLAVQNAAAQFGVYGKAAGLAGSANADFSKNLVGLSTDLASFYNTDPAAAAEAISAGLRGESEPLRQYGVLLDDATLRNKALQLGLISTTKDALTPQQKVLAAQASIMEQTTLAQGDFARTSGGLANQQRILSAQWTDMKGKLGQVFLPGVTATVTALNEHLFPSLEGLGAKASTAFSGIGANVGKAFADLKPQLEAAWGTLTTGNITGAEADSNPLIMIASKLREFGLATFEKLQGIWNTLWDTAEKLWNPIKQIATSLFDAFNSVQSLTGGMSPLEALWDGLLWAFQKVADLLNATLVPAFTWLGNFMKDNQPVVLTLVGAFVLWRVAMLASLAVTWAIIAAQKIYAAGQWALNAAMEANPIALVVIALVALAAAVVWAYNNVGWFKDAVDTAWSFIKDATTKLWENVLKPAINWIADNIHVVGDFFIAMWVAAQPVFDFLKASFENFLTVIQGVIDFVVGVFTGDWSRAWEGIKQIAGAVWDQIVAYVSLAWDLITGIGGKILEWLGAFAGWAWDRIVAIASLVVGWGSEFLSWLWDGIKAKAVEVFGWFASLPGWIWERIAALGAIIVTYGAQFLSWVWDGIKNTAVSVFQWFTDLPGEVWNRIVVAAQWVIDRGSEFIGWIKSGIETGAQAIWDWVTALPGVVWQKLLALKDAVLKIGQEFVGWIVSGVTSVASDIWNAITDSFTKTPEEQKAAADARSIARFGPHGAGGGVAGRGVTTTGAGGGVFPGYAPGVDSIHAMLSPGEGVMVPEFVEMVGPEWVYGMNALARAGRYVSPDKILGVEHFATGGLAGAKTQAIKLGADLAWAEAVKKLQEMADAAASGGVNLAEFTTSQDPSSFGWQRAANIQPFAWNGLLAGAAGGTQNLWAALLNALAPSIPGGIKTLGMFENRNNVNNPGVPSFHAYGLAADINAPWNPNGVSGYGRSGQYVIPSGPAHSLAARYGMLWGGDFSGTPDPMHFEIHLPPSAIGGAIAGTLGQGVTSAIVSGSGVERWRATVLQALGLTGQAPGFANYVLHQMDTESSGNPRAINLTDSNARRGTPSKGLMQVIDPTFQSYRLPQLSGDIYDPLANIAAAIRYVLARYGSIPAGMRGVAYDTGGWLMPGMTGANLGPRPEAVLNPAQSDALITHARNLEAGFAGQGPIIINLDSSDPLQVAVAQMIRDGVDDGLGALTSELYTKDAQRV